MSQPFGRFGPSQPSRARRNTLIALSVLVVAGAPPLALMFGAALHECARSLGWTP